MTFWHNIVNSSSLQEHHKQNRKKIYNQKERQTFMKNTLRFKQLRMTPNYFQEYRTKKNRVLRVVKKMDAHVQG